MIDSIIAPVPKVHLESGLEIQKLKGWFALGSDAWEFLRDVQEGAKVLIYVSHDEAEPLVTYEATFEGVVSEPIEMYKLKKNGYRPKTTEGEKWGCYWKISNVVPLSEPIEFNMIKLKNSGKELDFFPHGPMAIS